MAASSIAARKKSIASAGGILQIDIPVQTSNLLNKSATHATSLYQQCSQLRERLMRIHDFPPYLALAANMRQSTDLVNQLWDCFALGVPLCFLFNLLPPPFTRIDVNTDPDDISLDDSGKSLKLRQHATAVFLSNLLTKQKTGLWDEGELFTITELINNDRNTNNFVKVVRTVTILVDKLPEHVFMEMNPIPSTPPSALDSPGLSTTRSRSDSEAPVPVQASDTARNNIIAELVTTERKYVGDLDIMQQFGAQLQQRGIMDADTLHHMFPGLRALLDFQQRFLIRMEQIAELPWPQQQWGRLFTENEDGFQVYEPYCAHYSSAADLVLMEDATLQGFAAVISAQELPAFLIKPVQRICKYPLLVESLIKAVQSTDYPYLDQLREGSVSAKRVADRVNEAQRRAENRQTLKSLETRVEDWKGHHVVNFGELLLDDVFVVTKSDVDREYHVFLFEKIILCCKEAVPSPPKKAGKSPSLLKKPVAPTSSSQGGGARKRTTPLLLKGRIFLNNVTVAQPANKAGSWSLQVWWKGDDDLEFFTLRCRNEEQLRLWETTITRLVKEILAKRASEKAQYTSIPRVYNSTNPAIMPSIAGHERGYSQYNTNSYYAAQQSSFPSAGPSMSNRSRYTTSDANPVDSAGSYSYSSSRNSSRDGFDDDELDSDYQYDQYSATTSGRGTPMGERRAANAKSMPPERDAPLAPYDRSRARTEDFGGPVLREWKNRPPAPAPTGALPALPAGRPGAPRGISTASITSAALSDASFGNGVRQPQLRSKFSATRLRSQYEDQPRYPGASSPAHNNGTTPPLTRSRSASQPSQPSFIPKQTPPPLPNGAARPHNPSSQWKRESGSSQSTGTNSSDYSPPHTMSPVTPYGPNDSNSSIRQQRSQIFNPSGASRGGQPMHSISLSQPVKVKVHYGEDLFVIVVPRATEFDDLVEKVGKKIRLCGPRREDIPLRVKYRDEDGDMVSLASNEDVQLAFESSQVTLYVA